MYQALETQKQNTCYLYFQRHHSLMAKVWWYVTLTNHWILFPGSVLPRDGTCGPWKERYADNSTATGKKGKSKSHLGKHQQEFDFSSSSSLLYSKWADEGNFVKFVPLLPQITEQENYPSERTKQLIHPHGNSW